MKSVAPSLLAILLFLPLTASAQAVRCVDDHAQCREGCTLEFGTSYRTRQKLGLCIEKCTRGYQTCEERFAKALEKPARQKRTSRTEPPPREPASTPTPPRQSSDEGTIAASSSAEPAPTARRAEAQEPAALAAPSRRAERSGLPSPVARKPKKQRDLFDWHPGDPE